MVKLVKIFMIIPITTATAEDLFRHFKKVENLLEINNDSMKTEYHSLIPLSQRDD